MIGKVLAATAAVGWLAVAPCARAADAKAELMAVDRGFSALSAREGAAAAFRDTMDPVDGLSFDAGRDPARGTAAVVALTQKNLGAGKLTWEPAEAFVSRGDDMGATWGRWRFDIPVAGAKPVTGRYVTVWRKDAAGAWKGLIDIGNPD